MFLHGALPTQQQLYANRNTSKLCDDEVTLFVISSNLQLGTSALKLNAKISYLFLEPF